MTPYHRRLLPGPRFVPQAFCALAVASILAASAFAQPPTTAATQPGSGESTTPVEPVEPLPPPAKPGLRFPDRDKKSARAVKDFVPVQSFEDNVEEHDTFVSLFMHARRFTPEELAAGARKDVSWADLMAKDDDHRDSYRFDLVRFEGRLIRLKRLEPYHEMLANGVTDLFEAWVMVGKDSKPVCLLLAECPAGVEPANDIVPSRTVTVAGYFFKVLSFETGEKASKADHAVKRNAPLLVARTLIAQPLSTETPGDVWRTQFLPAVLTAGGAITAAVLAMAWYFRRGDRASKRAVDANRANPFDGAAPPPPSEEGDATRFGDFRGDSER